MPSAHAKSAAAEVARRLFDGDGGGVSIKGGDLDLWAEPSAPKDGRPSVVVWGPMDRKPRQTYRSSVAFARDLARLLDARRVSVTATDARSRVYFTQEAGPVAPRVPTLTDLRDPEAPARLAREFSRVVRGHFTRAEFQAVRRLQAQFMKQNGGSGKGCASAPDSFADANLLMADAWERVGLLDPIASAFKASDAAHATGGQEAADLAYEAAHHVPEYAAGCDLWNRAYALAIEAGYDPLQVGMDGDGPFTCPRCDRATAHEEGGAESPLCDTCADTLSPYWRGYWAGVEGWGADAPHEGAEAYARGHARGKAEAEALAGVHVGGAGAIA